MHAFFGQFGGGRQVWAARIIFIVLLLTPVLAFGDRVKWTGCYITVQGSTARVSVDLDCDLDSEDEGRVSLIVQDDDFLLLESADDSDAGKVSVERGRRKLTVTKRVKIEPDQLVLQVWTPLFPEGENSSSVVERQFYRLRKAPQDAPAREPEQIDTERYVTLYKQLDEAIEAGEVATARKLIEGEARTFSLNGMLRSASGRGQLEIVKLLLDKGARVNSRDPEGETALMRAAFSRHADCVQALLDKGADPKLKDPFGSTALTVATAAGNLEIIKILINRGADVRSEPIYGLMVAIKDGKTGVIEALVTNGVRVIATEKELEMTKFSPLTLAARQGDLETLRLLMAKGAEVDGKDSEGATALIRAAQSGKLEAARFLIGRGADVDAKDESGDTPLIHAITSESTTATDASQFAKLLLDKKANVNSKNGEGNTALMMAACHGCTEVVEQLLKNGATVNARNREDMTALSWVARGNSAEKAMLSMLGGDFASEEYQNDQKLSPPFDKIASLLRRAGGKE